MIPCSVFRLNVLRTGEDCKFQLASGEGEPLFASLRYPGELTTLYEQWKQFYLRAYSSPVRGRAEDDFSFTPSSIDWKNKVEEAEKAFLLAFHRWLGGQELLTIRQKIQSEAARKPSQKKRGMGNGNCVDLLIACETSELVRFPWEAWEIAPKDSSLATIRISRTCINVGNNDVSLEDASKRGATRILVILADTSELNLLEDQRAVQSSLCKSRVTKVEFLKFKSGQNVAGFREEITAKIKDERGWDVLIFAGHSDETTLTGGRLELAPNVSLSLSELELALAQAKNRGLRVAIFNSCKGLSIAEYLIKLGLSQVVVMRERIHDSAAHAFLKEFCKSLATHKDVHSAILDACQYFWSEKIAYPSAYLIPSLFRYPSPKAELFRIEPFGWKRFWQDWKPSPREAIALSTILLLSFMSPVQDLLLDSRTFMQAVYRHITNQFPAKTKPPVLLIAIDQESINLAGAEIDGFDTMPMDREYLGKLVKRLSDLEAKTVGIDYLLDISGTKYEKLAKPIEDAVKKGTWFVFGTNRNIKLTERIVNSNWSLQADTSFLFGDVQLPLKKNDTCPQAILCPFAYLLALSHLLTQHSNATEVLHPTLANQPNLQGRINQYLSQYQPKNNQIAILKKSYHPRLIRSIIDFSLPPKFAYERLPAWKFLELDFPNPELQKQLQEQVVIIAPGGYFDAWDNYSLPLARQYWCHFPARDLSKKDCPEHFTGGEIHAYMIYHLLSQHRVLLIPDILLITIAIIFGKGILIVLLKQEEKKRKKWPIIFSGITLIHSLFTLQIYLSANLVIPWLLPSVIFWFYPLSVLRRKSYA
ncbi:CHASE2 domain-containing protein [Cyanobacteria bacterium FACHB-472]|nr:CHASE2 domain-containing protein [Cyanobacteria bacterium FACHB-472]